MFINIHVITTTLPVIFTASQNSDQHSSDELVARQSSAASDKPNMKGGCESHVDF